MSVDKNIGTVYCITTPWVPHAVSNFLMAAGQLRWLSDNLVVTLGLGSVKLKAGIQI